MWGVNGVWLYFVLGESLALLCTTVYVWRKNGCVSLSAQSFLLLNKDFGVQPENLMEMDIHSIDEMVVAVEQVGIFCRRHGQDEIMAYHIALCVEEMAGNVVLHGFEADKSNHLSVRIQHKDNQWILDDCCAFDPVSYTPEENQDALGIQMVMTMAVDIRYSYSLNLNNLMIRLSANGTSN